MLFILQAPNPLSEQTVQSGEKEENRSVPKLSGLKSYRKHPSLHRHWQKKTKYLQMWTSKILRNSLTMSGLLEIWNIAPVRVHMKMLHMDISVWSDFGAVLVSEKSHWKDMGVTLAFASGLLLWHVTKKPSIFHSQHNYLSVPFQMENKGWGGPQSHFHVGDMYFQWITAWWQSLELPSVP